MHASFQIRAALPEDIDSIFQLDRSIENAPHWALADYWGAISPADYTSGRQGVSRCLFLAEDQDADIGFAVGKVTRIDAEVLADLESVGVVEPARRLGVGRGLCEAVIAWSRRQGASHIELEVRSRSAGAIALYAGLGFQPAGLRASYYRGPEDDAVVMRLMLA